MKDKRGRSEPRFRVAKLRGEPIAAGGRTFIPVARVFSFGQARGTVGTYRLEGWGAGLVHVAPLALAEVTPAGEQQVRVVDATGQALSGIFLAAVLSTAALAVVRAALRARASSRALKSQE